MGYMRAAAAGELAAGQMKLVTLEGKPILLANLEGEHFAIGNRCTHMGGSLAQGKIEGGAVKCPRHGRKFDLKTGKSLSGVKDEPSYRVKIEGNEVLVEV